MVVPEMVEQPREGQALGVVLAAKAAEQALARYRRPHRGSL